MLVVQIEKPANMTLAQWFSELRLWLDQHSCEDTSFSQSGRIIDKLIFNLTFHDHAKARLFAANFTRYSPSIRDTIGSERPDLLRRESRGGSRPMKTSGPP